MAWFDQPVIVFMSEYLVDCIIRYTSKQTSQLMDVSTVGHVDKIKADIQHDCLHFTPLIYARRNKIYTKYDRKLEVFNACMNTKRNFDIIKYLVENGADVNREKPYELDGVRGEIFDYLVKHHADIQEKNNEGMTLLRGYHVIGGLIEN
ncbi:hypothetical protein U3516DRAFT_732918 [Neocallimastix sp. 'constans']